MSNKAKIWSEECKKDVEDFVYFTLKHIEDKNQIYLVTCDKDGSTEDRGNILLMDFDYKVIITSNAVSEDVPIKTDLYGCPLVVTENEAKDFERDIMHQKLSSLMRERMHEEMTKKPESATIN